MKPITIFLALLLIGFAMNVNATDGPFSTPGTVVTNANTATVPITVTNFNSVRSCDLKILYDQNYATADAVTLASGVSGTLGEPNLTIPGEIRFAWSSPSPNTLADNSVLFYIHFKKVKDGTAAIIFDDDLSGVGCQYYDGSGSLNDIPTVTYYKTGSVTFNSNAPVIIAPIATYCTGSVSIPVTVTNFNNITSVSLKLTYDQTVLTSFSGGTSSVLGCTFGNTTPGEIIIGGSNFTTDGVSLPDGSVFLTLNFTKAAGNTNLTWVNSDPYGQFTGPGVEGVASVLVDTPPEDFYKNGSVTAPTSTQTVWTGTTNTAWNTATNWCGSALPTSAIDAIIPKTTTLGRMPLIGTTYNASCKDLIMDNGASLSITSGLTTSGSLIVYGTASATGTITYRRQFKVADPVGIFDNFDWHYFSSPLGNVSTSTPGIISNIYPWDEVAGAWGTPFTDFSLIKSGKGYKVYLDQTAVTGDPTDGMIYFTGSIVKSTSVQATSPYTTGVNTSLTDPIAIYSDYVNRWTLHPSRASFGGGGWNLLGNPFTSAMDGVEFINYGSNAGSFDPNYKALYVYDGENNKYLYIGVPGGDWTDIADDFGRYVQVGQGFFVLAQTNNVNFYFDGSVMQAHSRTTLLKSASVQESWPGLRLKVKYGEKESNTLIIYNDQMTAGLDPGYDVGQLSAGPEVEIYTALLKDNGVNFARQALPLAGNEKNIVPVGIDCEKGANVTFSAYLVPIGNGTFYLEDRTLGTFTDLSKNSYSVTLPAKTAGTGRFYIHTSMVTGIQPVLANNELGVRIWNVDNKVNIEGAVSSKATGAIYDLLGRQLLQTRLSDSNFNTLSVPSEFRGIYLVKVVDGEKMCTQKVVF